MARITWGTITKEMDEALNVCRSMGLAHAAEETFNSDRIGHHVALAESATFGGLAPFLQTQEPKALRPKVERVLIGPLLPRDEDENSSHGRNILFELQLAAQFASAGLTPVLGEHPDLHVEVDGHRLLIECKRPASLAGARKAITKARDQLLKHLKKAPVGSRGVIALSVTKLMNPGDLLFRYSGDASGKEALAAEIERHRERLADSWTDRLHGKITGMIWHVITPAVDESVPIPTVAQNMTCMVTRSCRPYSIASKRWTAEALAKLPGGGLCGGFFF